MVLCSNGLIDTSHRICGHTAQQVELVDTVIDFRLETEYEWLVVLTEGPELDYSPMRRGITIVKALELTPFTVPRDCAV